MKSLVAIGNKDVFYVVPNKFLKEIATKETNTTVHYKGNVYIVYFVINEKDIQKLKRYEKKYILMKVLN